MRHLHRADDNQTEINQVWHEATENAANVILHMVLDEEDCDEFLTWYKPDQWLGPHRAVATFIRIKLRRRPLEQ
jgi:hypothetical protein